MNSDYNNARPPSGSQRPPYQAPPPIYQPPRQNGTAVASMVLGIAGIATAPLGLILGPLALIFARKAKKQIAERKEGGDSFAKAGTITGGIAMAVSFFVCAILVGGHLLANSLFSDFGNSDGFIREFNEEWTISDMNSLADKIDDFMKDNSRLPEDSQIIEGEIVNINLFDEIRLASEYSIIMEDDFTDHWDRPIVYDRLVGPDGKDEFNPNLGYDKAILKKANPTIKPTYILWSKGHDPDDPKDDIFFIKGRGIVRPDGYESKEKED